jgi:hypothetical protein
VTQNPRNLNGADDVSDSCGLSNRRLLGASFVLDGFDVSRGPCTSQPTCARRSSLLAAALRSAEPGVKNVSWKRSSEEAMLLDLA